MIQFDDLELWTREYFEKPENIRKSEKACEHYDRLLMANIRKMMMEGGETIEIEKAKENDPGKRLEKTQYEFLPASDRDGNKGRIRIDLLDRTAEFIK